MDDRYQDPEPRARAGAIRLRVSGGRAELAEESSSFQLGPYELRRAIVVGRVGVVFEAMGDPDDGLSVAAVHVPLADFQDDPVFVDRYLSRAARCRGLTHAGLVETWEGGETGLIWRAMEFVGGGTLNDLIRNQRRPPLSVVLRILRQVGDVYGYLHGRGVVHGRLNPMRVRLGTDGQVKVCGHATVEPEGLALEPMEMSWRAPEQLDGETTVASDVYQLGVLGLFLLTGQNPFTRVTVPQTAKAVGEEWPSMPQGLPNGLNEVIQASLEKRASARPKLEEFRASLATVDVSGPRGWHMVEPMIVAVGEGEVQALRRRLADGRVARRTPPPPPPPLLLPRLMGMPSMLDAPSFEMMPPVGLGIPTSENSLVPDDESTEPNGGVAPVVDASALEQSPARMLLWGLALGILGGLATAAAVLAMAGVVWWLVYR